MKSVLAGVIAAMVVAGSGAAMAAAQESKTVRGTVTTVAPGGFTVKVAEEDMKFVVDKSTMVTAHGSTKAKEQAAELGKSGAAFNTLVKAGQGVEVKYHVAGMHAYDVTVLPSAAAATGGAHAEKHAAGEAPAATTSNGVVTAVSGSSLTLKASTGEMVFTIDSATHVVGSGLGTKSRQEAAAGKSTTLTDVVKVGDSVSVTWKDASGSKQATSVRVRTSTSAR